MSLGTRAQSKQPLQLVLYSMSEITVKIRRGQKDLRVVQYESHLSVAQAKQAVLEEKTGWVGSARRR